MSSDKNFHVEIVTPESIVFSGETDSLIVSSFMGMMGILKSHAPFLGVLKPGKVKMMQDGKDRDIEITLKIKKE